MAVAALPAGELGPARARVFVGNMPLPRDMPDAAHFEAWFDREMHELAQQTEGSSERPDGGEHPDGGAATDGAAKEAPASPSASPSASDESQPASAHRYTDGIEQWSNREGVCFVRLKEIRYLPLALALNGRKCYATYLAVCPPQCLPDPAFASLPIAVSELPTLHVLPHWKNKAYLVFSNAAPKMQESELQSLFEALGGPLDSLYLFTSEELRQFLPEDANQHASLGCGRCSYSNSLIIESVIQRLRQGLVPGVEIRVALLVDACRAEVLASLERSSQGYIRTSISEQIMSDALCACLLRTSRMVGARPSRVVQLYNFIWLEDILCDTLRSELLAAVKQEAEKFGRIDSIVCPLPNTRLGALGPDSAGASAKVFLEYADTLAARRAQAELNGRTFNGRVVCATFYPVLPFQLKRYYLACP